MAADLQNPIFTDEDKAREALEAALWPNGRVCPHCGNTDEDTMPLIEGKKHSHRAGLYACRACRGQFTVTVGTVFERSKIPLSKWWLAVHLMSSSKKGISAHQLWRMLGFGSYRTAWFMAHRVREAMRELNPSPIGGEGKTVEADETVVGGKERNKHKSKRNPKNIGAVGKQVAFALVERGGKVRSTHVPNINAKTLEPILTSQSYLESALMTDDAGQYRLIGPAFARFETVNHGADEYVRGDAHTNTIEGYFSILKRGITGVYHHVSEAHLQRYLAEFDFRYNQRTALGVNDAQRTLKAMEGIAGKRLTYRRTGQAPNA